ncbi:MAG: hypothetical protein ABIJ97_04115 [Bacteroidota bacterium]
MGIEWTYNDKVIEVYKHGIDSAMNSLIDQFNNENRTFVVHNKLDEDSMFLTIEFNDSRFVSDDGLAAGYIITFLGVVFTPFATLTATDGTFFFAFWFIPADYLKMKGALSPLISEMPEIKKNISVQAGALFTSKKLRVKNISTKASLAVHQLLLGLDYQLN